MRENRSVVDSSLLLKFLDKYFVFLGNAFGISGTGLWKISLAFLFLCCAMLVVGLTSEYSFREQVVDEISEQIAQAERAASASPNDSALSLEKKRLVDLKGTAVDLSRYGNNGGSLSIAHITSQIRWHDRETLQKNGIQNQEWDGGYGSALSRIFGFFSSNAIFAFTILICGYIGALAGAVYQDIPHNYKSEIIGTASGLIVYLSIKGGKFVFFIHNSTDPGSLNIYSAALAAFLAGFLSDKVFSYMRSLTITPNARQQTPRNQRSGKPNTKPTQPSSN